MSYQYGNQQGGYALPNSAATGPGNRPSVTGPPIANGPSSMMNSSPNQGPKVASQNGQINRMPYQNQPLHGLPTAGPPQPSKQNQAHPLGQPLSFGPPSGPNSLSSQPQMPVRPQGGSQYNAPPPTSIGAPPTRMGAPPTKIGPPPKSMGAPPTNIGAPPKSMGAPPTSIGAQAMNSGPPTSNMGGLSKGNIGPPTSLQGPSNVGLPSASSGSLTQTRAGPPSTSSSSGQPVFDPETGTWQYPPAQENQGQAVQDSHIHPGQRRPYPKPASPTKAVQGPAATGPSLSSRPMPVQNSQFGPQSPSLQRQQFNSGPMVSNQNQQGPNAMPGMPQMTNSFGRLTVEQANVQPIDLLERRVIVPPVPVEPPVAPVNEDFKKKAADPKYHQGTQDCRVCLHKRSLDSKSWKGRDPVYSHRIFRCTFNAIPESSSLLNKSRLPFGVYIQPFRDIPNLPVITSSVITRCKVCRTYLNPFVTVVDQRRWQCNICFRINDIPSDLSYDPITKAFIDPRKRPELNHASFEFVAPSEYMLRPPQPAVFLFVFDVSFNAIGTGYLAQVCRILRENLDNLPGDSRTLIGFLTFNSSIHFYSLKANQTQPQMMVMSDIDDVFIPSPDGLLVNLKENKEMVIQFLESLPQSFAETGDVNSCTGAAMQIAHKMISSTGGRITVFQTCLPSVGPGKLARRELSNMSGNSKDSQKLGPATDFYKKLALDCAGDQVAIDLFVLTGQYVDLASLSCASKYSSGCVHYFPDFHASKNPLSLEKFENDFRHYLTRRIGFEAVMRTRCAKGLNIHTFHGNFFVRSTDLLSLPNVNPDHSFSMQIEIEDNLADHKYACFQAALLYTTSRGERRIRVHTMAIPVTNKLSDVFAYADQQSIASLLSKMAVDRSVSSSLGDAREALMNACQDCLKVYRNELSGQRGTTNILAPSSLKLLPLYALALMKYDGFRLGSGVSLDSRVYSMLLLKTLPLDDLIVSVYPRLYSLTDLFIESDSTPNNPAILNCSGARLNRQGIFIMDCGKAIYIFIGKNVQVDLIRNIFNFNSFQELPEAMVKIPELDNPMSIETRKFIDKIKNERCYHPVTMVFREDSRSRMLFINNLVDDRSESVMSYQEFLLHIQRQINN